METLVVVGIIVLIIVILGIYLWSTYNGLIRLNVRVDEAWSDITVQLKRRADLIPNIIEAVKGYAAHEKAVFENVTRARAETLSAQGPAEAGAAENHMQTALKSIFAVAEAYPQLQASQNFLQLQGELLDTEDKIQASRKFDNGGVTSRRRRAVAALRLHHHPRRDAAVGQHQRPMGSCRGTAARRSCPGPSRRRRRPCRRRHSASPPYGELERHRRRRRQQERERA